MDIENNSTMVEMVEDYLSSKSVGETPFQVFMILYILMSITAGK